MATIINMPRLSDTMEEGVVAQWLVKVGDKIEEGDILAEIETDKATMEFESFHEGTLLHIGVQEGETSPVDQLLAIIGEEGEANFFFSKLCQNTDFFLVLVSLDKLFFKTIRSLKLRIISFQICNLTQLE